jgi:hypothetical protein
MRPLRLWRRRAGVLPSDLSAKDPPPKRPTPSGAGRDPITEIIKAVVSADVRAMSLNAETYEVRVQAMIKDWTESALARFPSDCPVRCHEAARLRP